MPEEKQANGQAQHKSRLSLAGDGFLPLMTITPDQEAELVGFARQMKDKLTDLTFEHKRRILELIRLRVDVLGQTKVRLTGVISSEGLVVDLESSLQS